MKRSELADMPCSLAGALAEIGDAWSLMVIKELLLGNRRFEGIHAQTGMSSNSLAQRLKALEDHGAVSRRAYQDHPVRYEYTPTEKGISLWPVLVSLTQWGDRWVRKGAPPLSFGHRSCGHDASPVVACTRCGAPMTARDADARMSAGMRRDRALRSRGN